MPAVRAILIVLGFLVVGAAAFAALSLLRDDASPRRPAPAARTAPAAGDEADPAAPTDAASDRPRESSVPTPPIREVADAARPGRQVILVGLDGGDWALLDRYMASGAMPNLARLARSGRGGVLRSEHPPLSPLLWTTMLTGVGPLEHGILDFARFHPRTGRKEPVTSEERQSPALWNMATWAGRSTAVFGMWATYPAEPVRGVVVSDRLFSFLYGEARPPAGVVYPAALEAHAREAVAAAERAVDYERVAEYLPWLDEEEYAGLPAAEDPYGHPVTALRRILVETAVYHRLAVEHIGRERPDLAVVYLQGTDTIGHTFARYAPPRLPGVSEEELERYGSVPQRYFREIDGLLGDYERLARESGAVLFLVSDHGFRWDEGRPAELSSHRNETAAKWHRPEGIFLLWGEGIEAAPGHGLAGDLRQVAPTVLALLGLPRAESIAEAPLPGVAYAGDARIDYRRFFTRHRFTPDATTAAATPTDATPDDGGEAGEAGRPDLAAQEPDPAAQGRDPAAQGRDPVAGGPDRAAEADLAKLRALGYLGGSDVGSRRRETEGRDAVARSVERRGERADAAGAPLRQGGSEAVDPGTWTAGAYNNRGLILRTENPAAAERAFAHALELDPELASAAWNLSDLLHAQDRDLERSDALLVAAVANGLPEGPRYLIGRAIGYQRAGRLERSIALLERAGRATPELPDVWLFLGRYEMNRQACGPALEHFQRAARLAPDRHEPHGASAMARLCVGDERGAIADLRRSLAIRPDQPELAAYLERLGS